MRLLGFIIFFGFIFLHAEDEVQNMEKPHTAENGARDIQVLTEHHKEQIDAVMPTFANNPTTINATV